MGDKVELQQVEYEKVEKQTQILTFCINSRFLNTIKKNVNKIGIFCWNVTQMKMFVCKQVAISINDFHSIHY